MKKYLFILILFICPFFVSAKNITSVDFGDYDVNNIGNYSSNNSILRTFNNHAWSGWGSGLLYGSLSISRSYGSATSDVPSIDFVKSISSNGQEYMCYFGSFARNNSTQEDIIYSFYCPTSMGLNGLEGMIYGFTEMMDNEGQANLHVEGTMTFVQDDSVNIDTSGIISSNNSNTQAVRDIGNQISGNVNQVNDSINNDNVDGANNEVNSLFDNAAFNDNSGIQSII